MSGRGGQVPTRLSRLIRNYGDVFLDRSGRWNQAFGVDLVNLKIEEALLEIRHGLFLGIEDKQLPTCGACFRLASHDPTGDFFSTLLVIDEESR